MTPAIWCKPGLLLLQVLLANVLVKIGAVFTVALPLVWLGGLLYHCTSGESLQISLFKVYAVLYRAPGKLCFLPHTSSTAHAHNTAQRYPLLSNMNVANGLPQIVEYMIT